MLALGWPNHQFHRAVVARLTRSSGSWATCGLTQLGFVRLSANAAVVGAHKAPGEAVALLEDLTADHGHVFIEALPPLPTAATFFDKLLGHQQVTDAYLLAIARGAGATLLTLDRRIVPSASHRKLVEVLAPL